MTRSATKLSRYCLAVVMSIAWACGSREGRVDDPSRSEASSTKATREVTVLPPVDAISEADRGSTPPAESGPSVQWPPGGKKCRLVHCSNRVFFVGEAPGGWKGELEVEVCVEDRCESMVVELVRAKNENSVSGRELIAEVISASLYCPPSLERVCATTGLGKRLAQQRKGQSLFVLALDTSSGKQPVQVEVTLSKKGIPAVVRSERVSFDQAPSCYRPNGSGCEPECCESVREF